MKPDQSSSFTDRRRETTVAVHQGIQQVVDIGSVGGKNRCHLEEQIGLVHVAGEKQSTRAFRRDGNAGSRMIAGPVAHRQAACARAVVERIPRLCVKPVGRGTVVGGEGACRRED